MIVPAFGGRDISSFAFELGEEWGVGQESLSNGIVIVVKPKDDTPGEVQIATGTGLEGALPDIFCQRIIDDLMIPQFKTNDYYGGIVNALTVIEPVCAGEYSYEQYQKDNNDNTVWGIVGLLTIGGVWYAVRKSKKGGGGSSSNSSNSSSGRTYYGGSYMPGGGYGGSSSGRSFSGGFGGGHFGGGGARGSW